MPENPNNPFWFPSTGVDGATFRDMFAAHAPDNIPDFFKPADVPDAPEVVMPPDDWFGIPRPGVNGAPDLVTKEDSDVYNEYYDYLTKTWNETGNQEVVIPQSTKDKVAAYEADYSDYVTDFNHWNRHYQKERYFQWRYYFADEMLLKRNGDVLS